MFSLSTPLHVMLVKHHQEAEQIYHHKNKMGKKGGGKEGGTRREDEKEEEEERFKPESRATSFVSELIPAYLSKSGTRSQSKLLRLPVRVS